MTSRTSTLHVLTGLMAAFALTVVAPSPAHAVSVTLNTSRTTAPPSVLVTFSGTAPGAATNSPVTLQRRPASGGPFSTVKTGGKVTSSDTYAMKIYVAVGKYSYRAKVGSSSYSPLRTVTGNYGRNVALPAAGSPFTFSARLPKPWTRLIRFQFSTNGSTGWTTRGQATSNSTGWVGIRTYMNGTSYVRAIAPATSSLSAWTGPRGIVKIGADPVITRILNDTNAYRTSQGKPALKLHASLNKVAGNWAHKMYTGSPSSCYTTLPHNPSYPAQYPTGWKAGAENVAAGQTYTTVVNGNQPGVQPSSDIGWIDSSGHRMNILGNYTHIGIGYYFGSAASCFQGRYYVQNFARY